MADTRTLHGLDDVLRKLKSLPPEIVSKRGGPVKSALRKGGKVIQQAYVANIEADAVQDDGYANSGLLSKSVALGRDPRPQQSGANERYRVFVRRKTYPDGTKTIATARYLEYGTERMAPRAPMARAFSAAKDRALSTVVDELSRGIERIVRKLSRGA